MCDADNDRYEIVALVREHDSSSEIPTKYANRPTTIVQRTHDCFQIKRKC